MSDKLKYEVVTFVCPSCGKKVSMVKLKSISIDGLLCQKCGQGNEKPEQD
ncbi:MAG: hypothetical protein KKA79_03215 [Nanoarchaeota archaeon]|nr:hypothetical protein [Nanoarchaeota archaeon]MCG2718751.1 hypothetical protein [Nanoarchaeota archaeon]